VTRLGASRPQYVDFRIVSATNKNLKEEVAAGRFREDLFYRISTLPVRLPPLRERPEDLPLLAAHFLQSPEIVLKRSAQTKLQHYRWPGNVRELRNVLERAILLSDGKKIEASDIMFDGEI
jgi:transcriptional regulator with GAF, ATPase, and Fis domain